MIQSFISKNRTELANVGLFVFRVSICILMLVNHGFGKATTLFVGEDIQFADPIGIGVTASFVLAAFAEFICSIFIFLGLWTRLSALILVINMIVATIVMISNGGNPELPLFYLLGFLLIFCCGGGQYSIDNRVYRNFK